MPRHIQFVQDRRPAQPFPRRTVKTGLRWCQSGDGRGRWAGPAGRLGGVFRLVAEGLAIRNAARRASKRARTERGGRLALSTRRLAAPCSAISCHRVADTSYKIGPKGRYFSIQGTASRNTSEGNRNEDFNRYGHVPGNQVSA